MSGNAPAAPFHARVIEELARQGKSKNWLHKRTGVARGTIDAWEKQPRPPQAGTVLAVATVLGIKENEALKLAGVLPANAPAIDTSRVDLSKMSTEEIAAEIQRLVDELRNRTR